VAPGSSCQLRISFSPGGEVAPAPEDVFINEFHYDNASTDTGEFVEIAVGPGYAGSLPQISLVLYDGNAGQNYGTHTLDTFTPGTVTTSGHRLFHKMISNLQNGPDGFAVVAGSTVLHFISYEGSFAATDGPAVGMMSRNIRVSQGGGDPVGQAALGLTGSGGVAADFSWSKFSGIAHSPGQPNNGQSFSIPDIPPQGLGFDNLDVEFLTDDDLDGLPDVNDPDDDNDGQSDADEAAFGTDPLNHGSRFAPVIAKGVSGLELSFPGAAGIHYTVEASDSLTGWQELTTVAGNGQPIVVPLPMAEPRMFFRVKAGGPGM
jgi:hypothetical protein